MTLFRSVNNAHRVDPTRTITLRARYEADIVRRFRALQRVIRDAVGGDDVLVLRGAPPGPNIPRPPRFDFRRDPDKVGAFMDWLERAQNAGILEIQKGTPLREAAASAWQNVYIRSAYQKGLARAAGVMESAGARVEDTYLDSAFFRPVHADRVGLAYTRAYSDLAGITAAMDTAISRTLAQGIAEGRGPMDLAKDLVRDVETIGIARARRLARTEVIRSHADATLASYREAGLEGVQVLSEFTTARDNAVCQRCAALEGKTYTLKQAEGIIPVHPNCRCAWLPVVHDMRGVELR